MTSDPEAYALHEAGRFAASEHTHDNTLDEQGLFLEVHLDGLELDVLGHQPHDGAFLPIALHGDLVLQASHHDLAAAHLRGAMHGNKVAIEDAGVFHTHAGNLEQVVWARLKQRRIDLQPGLEVLLGEDGPAGSHPADERQAHLLAHGVLELDATGGP